MIFSALILGLAGSLHCIGMCSPLLVSITSLRKQAVLNRLLYNAGRIFTYAILGLIVSMFSSLFKISQFQTILSVSLGLILIALGIADITSIRIPLISKAVIKLTGFIKSKYVTFLSRKNTLSTLMMGMLNGLLPCGLTYVALTYCLTVERILDGAVFMLMFGLGTLPAMIGGSSIILFLLNRFSLKASRLTVIIMIGIGCLLVLRPLLIHNHTTSSNTGTQDITICR